jgi:hypothetical protein
MGEDDIGGYGFLVIIELEELHDHGQGRARFVTHSACREPDFPGQNPSTTTSQWPWVFSRPEPREVFAQLVGGLLSGLPKKNGWTLAEYAGHTHPGRVQTFLSRGAWDAGDLESRVRDLVVEEMGDPEAVLIVDDTQMIKKGS